MSTGSDETFSKSEWEPDDEFEQNAFELWTFIFLQLDRILFAFCTAFVL